jgi:Na+/proline symporter
MFGWSMVTSVAIIGVPTVIYTMIGGVQAVTWADVKQMVMVVCALGAVVVVLLVKMPVSPEGALRLAGATGRLRVFDFSTSLSNTYTFWSGIIGGTFLMLSYFGTDQSQVQRYLSAKSIDEARSAHLISAYWKIPLQALVLLVGILIFVYYMFLAPPLYFNPAQGKMVQKADPAAYAQIDSRYHTAFSAREAAARELASTPRDADATQRAALKQSNAAVEQVHTDALSLAERISGTPSKDVNYIIPHFVLNELPIGLTGLFIAAVIAAAMSAVAGELSALSTATVIDFYRRWFVPDADDKKLLFVSRAATGAWGLFACVVATFAASLGSLIEVVNRFGSIFYGSILGVFILAMMPRIRANAAFVGLIAGMAAVLSVIVWAPQVSFLWHNVVGVVVVVVVGVTLTLLGWRSVH